ncbi:hypothetical protein BJF85_18610 [Saccharomonospora sp. CUA-673]|nr:hypothetical protein BJF85_18610 [Saccharomonospora sp. CUA-673]
MRSPRALEHRVTRLLQTGGLSGIVLAAAVLVDVAMIAPRALDGSRDGGDLVLLPGIVAFAACAMWARRRSVVAGLTGAAVLVMSSVLTASTGAMPSMTLLVTMSLAECVAGTLLVYYCVRSAAAIPGAVTVVLLLVAQLGSMEVRGMSVRGLGLGGLLLGAALVTGAIAFGTLHRTVRARSPFGELLRHQWLLVGMLALTLFLDGSMILGGDRTYVVMALPAAASALAALHATRRPIRAVGALVVIYILSNVLMRTAGLEAYTGFGGLTTTAVVAGMITVALVVRTQPPLRATVAVATLSAVVGSGAIIQVLLTSRVAGTSMLPGLVISASLLLGMSIAIGMFLRARDSERTTSVEAAVTEAQTAERMALARELHDIVAHYVTGIVVQAQAAKIVAKRDPDVVPDSLDQIENAGTEALVAMRRLVRSMRGDGDGVVDESATTDLAADLQALATSGAHGVRIELDADVPDDLPQELARSALRIVQESLTNVSKHAAGATTAWVSVRPDPDSDGDPEDCAGLRVRVADDGSSGGAGPLSVPGGYGLVGMRERVALLNGTLRTGRGAGGWVVEAWLPLAGEPAGDEENE